MFKTKKKLLAILMAIALVSGNGNTVIYAAVDNPSQSQGEIIADIGIDDSKELLASIVDSGECGTNAIWTLDSDGVLIVSGTGPMKNSIGQAIVSSSRTRYVKKVIINDGITSIGGAAFFNCSNLTEVTIGKDVQEIGWQAFAYTSLKSVRIPGKVHTIKEGAFTCDTLESFSVDSQSTYFTSIDGVLFTKDRKTLVQYPGGLAMEEYVIPDGTETIGFMAFQDIRVPSSVRIPASVNHIKDLAFARKLNSLGSVYFEGDIPSFACDEPSSEYRTFEYTSTTFYCKDEYSGWLKFRPSSITNTENSYPITVEYINMSAEAHIFGDFVEIKSTCVEPGGMRRICSVCGAEEWKDKTAALGHNIINGSCTRCGLPGGFCGDAVIWTYDAKNKELAITGNGNIKNYSYIKEVPWYPYVNQINSIKIAEDITAISDYAFYGIANLKEIKIPDSVKTIGEYAFKNCTGLEYVTMPKSLSKLGESAFFGCTSLKSITIPEGLYTIWGYTFKNCTTLESVSLPQSLIKIDEAAFYGCSSLTTLIIPDSCAIVGQYAFKNCTNLKDLTLPESMTEIREATFYATAVETLDVPSKVTKVGPYAFKKCTNLVTLNLPAGLTTIGESAFYGSAMRSLELPDAVTKIGAYAFKGCESLTDVHFPANLTTIGDSAFYYCTALERVDLSGKLITIEGYAFKNCNNLTSVNLPASLTTIGDSAFYSCTKLSEITIPAKVTSVGGYCFSKDTALKNITFLGNAPAIGSYAFNNVVGKVYYPKNNSTWTPDKKQNYGGTITWMAK